MKARYIKALSLGLAGVLLLSMAALSNSKTEVVAEEANMNVRAGICAEIDTEALLKEENTQLTAGVTDVIGVAMEEAAMEAEKVAVASVTETQVTNSLTGQTMDTTIYGYTNIGIAEVDDGNLNVREGAGTDFNLVGKMPNHAACEILEIEGEWYKIQSGEVIGYVKGEYLVTGDDAAVLAESYKQTIAKSNTTTLNVRAEANTDCSIITTVAEGEALEVVEVLDGWIKVNIDSDEGYISADYADVLVELPKAMTMTEVRYGQGVSDVRVSLVQYACQFIGNPYVWGGTSLTRGADCSGFVLSVFANYGVSLPHSSRSQANSGTKISADEAEPGDLFFYGNGKSINHVAIYIGNGQVVHASSPKSGIKISSAYYRTPVKVVRILND